MENYIIREYNGEFHILTKRTYRRWFGLGRLRFKWVQTNKNGGVFLSEFHSSTYLLEPLYSKKEAIQCINRLKKIVHNLNKSPKYYTSEGKELKDRMIYGRM